MVNRLDAWVSGDAEPSCMAFESFCGFAQHAATRQDMIIERVVLPSCARNPFAALALALALYRLKLSLHARLDTV